MHDPKMITVGEGTQKVRADKILATEFPDVSRTRLQEAFEQGHVTLKGAPIKKNYKVSEGDCLEIILPEVKAPTVSPVDIPLDIVFEDDDIVVVNKSSGMVTHPGSGTGEDTLVHALLHHCDGKLSPLSGELRPGVVHRLDKETSGLIVFAKSDAAYQELISLFASRSLDKQYLALVKGIPRLQSGSIQEPIRRNPVYRVKMQVHPRGKLAHTDWAVEDALKYHALLRCWLHTGRTHQIRVHLANIGHPIIGDKTYGCPDYDVARVCLHATELTFKHPVNGKKMHFSLPLPPDFLACMEKLRMDENHD